MIPGEVYTRLTQLHDTAKQDLKGTPPSLSDFAVGVIQVGIVGLALNIEKARAQTRVIVTPDMVPPKVVLG